MKLEICVDCLESARAASSGGADRLEVCSTLAMGGVTPSAGLIEQCLELAGMEVVVMIRPHPGGFCYGPEDIETMLRDIRHAKQLGAHGIVTGALLPDGRVDRDRCRSRTVTPARLATASLVRAR